MLARVQRSIFNSFKIMSSYLIVALTLLSSSAFAADNISDKFQGYDGCFILYDLKKNKRVAVNNSKRCETRLSPCSSFKIALSLMGFESGIFKDENNPVWQITTQQKQEMEENFAKFDDKIKKPLIEAWMKNQSPQSWMKNSVVWYSQDLTNKLGMEKFKNHLNNFDYGNMDVSGNPGKNDGLTQSWLMSSLKISADEQIQFLRKLLTYQLPVSKSAIDYTKNISFLEDLPSGWKLYGKTGGGSNLGWFVGWIEKSGQTYIFAANITPKKEQAPNPLGMMAKKITREIFLGLDFLN